MFHDAESVPFTQGNIHRMVIQRVYISLKTKSIYTYILFMQQAIKYVILSSEQSFIKQMYTTGIGIMCKMIPDKPQMENDVSIEGNAYENLNIHRSVCVYVYPIGSYILGELCRLLLPHNEVCILAITFYRKISNYDTTIIICRGLLLYKHRFEHYLLRYLSVFLFSSIIQS